MAVEISDGVKRMMNGEMAICVYREALRKFPDLGFREEILNVTESITFHTKSGIYGQIQKANFSQDSNRDSL